MKLKLTYFDFHGGRGEPARLAFHLGGIDFEDYRFPFAEFAAIKSATPLAQVPVLEVDGTNITQGNAITRFAGKLAGLYPSDNVQALLCDEVMDGVEDVTGKMVATFHLSGDELVSARKALADGPLTTYLKWLDSKLAAAGGEYFADNRLTIADLKVFVWVRTLNAGRLDHVPTDLVAQVAPRLTDHMKRIADEPKIAAYYAA